MHLLLVALLLAGQYVAPTKYDPSRNADLDIKAAIAEAQKTGKRVLLEVGGEWCSWCHILDKYFVQHPELTALRDRNYVLVKINYSPENENKAVLSRYPKIAGYPFIFVLDMNGKLLLAQQTGALEEGQSYNLKKMTTFLQKWAPTTPSQR